LGNSLFRGKGTDSYLSNKVSLISGNNGRVKNVNYRFDVNGVVVCIQSKCTLHVPIICKC